MLVSRRLASLSAMRPRASAVQTRSLGSWWWDKNKKEVMKTEDLAKDDRVAEEKSTAGATTSQTSADVDVQSERAETVEQVNAEPVNKGSETSNIASVLALQGAPRQPSVLALPLDRRPLFPGLLHPIQITDRAVYEALVRTRASGNPYIGVFLRKHDIKARDFVEQAPSDRILSISEVHQMGTFAQIVQMEPLHGVASAAAGGQVHDEDVEYENPDEQQQKQDLRKALFSEKRGGGNASGNSFQYSDNASQMVANAKEESWTLVVKAHRRIQIEELLSAGPPPLVKVQHISEAPLSSYEMSTIRAYTNEILATLRDVIRHNPLLREHMQFFSTRFDMSDPHHVCNLAASLISADGVELQEVLEALNLEARLKKVLTLLKKEVQLNAIQEEISKQVEETISANQRKYFLNEQLKQIKKELGLEHDDKDALLQRFQDKYQKLQQVITLEDQLEKEQENEDDYVKSESAESAANPQDSESGAKKTEKEKRLFTQNGIPAEARKVIEDELKKLSTLEKTSPEFNVSRGYLDWLLNLPWTKASVDNLDISHAQSILEGDHFGLSDIKERILEFIAVGNLRGTVQGKIILLVGPPGVGKTSIGKSIAHALDRDFYRFSVGGLSDVSEIKGHRRTYIGAMPGKLIQCLKSTGVSNPVVLIDEIDKLGSGYRGDPASALLELLDPAQNSSFLDHYLDIPVDLSKVLFVCTANTLDTIPGPLLDRMEILRLSGYDLPEKVEIAKRYLEPRAKRDCGLVTSEENSSTKPETVTRKRKDNLVVPSSLGLDESAITSLARWYCRESGVRKLEQEIEKIYRKLTLEVLKASEQERIDRTWTVSESNLEKYVGKPRYQSEKLYEATPPPGVVMGLAWSPHGGSSLYVETTAIRRANVPSAPEDGKEDRKKETTGFGISGFSVHTTGQLGDVMKESTSLALTYAKHKLQEAEPGNMFFEQNQIHLHVPEGAIPKDGPSAGITMTTALLSLALKRSVKPDLAMTGEISLTGMVLPVGGIKEKVIAARRSGVNTIILPNGNRKDMDELPDYLKKDLVIHFAKHYDDVFKAAFE